MGMVQAKKMGFGRVDSMHRRRGIGGRLPRCLLVLLSICIAACAGTKDLDWIAERIGNYIRHDTTKLKKRTLYQATLIPLDNSCEVVCRFDLIL